MIALKVVLTGGPCAGKSTGISKVSKHLRELGYTVYIVEESATKLINQGIKPFGNNKIDMLTFQEMVLNQQMAMEKIYEIGKILGGLIKYYAKNNKKSVR